jgi:hypothetical protein
LQQCRVGKPTAGFAQLGEKIDKFELPAAQCYVSMETAHNLLIEFLWSRRYAVYVIPSSVVNSLLGSWQWRGI